MDIRQLTYFVAIAECGSFSEASRRCFISQSAISQQMKMLEDDLKTVLFTRTPHKVTLTDSGKVLLPLARNVLQNMELCKKHIQELNEMMTGELSIGLTYSLESHIRQPVMKFFHTYPKVKLKIYYKTIPELIIMLRNGELDMAFSLKVRGEEDWVDSLPVHEYRLCAVMRKTHPLASRSFITFDDLKLQKLILPENGIKGHNAIEHFLHNDAEQLHIKAIINNPHAIMNLLAETNCISVLTDQMAKGDERLTAIPIKEMWEPFTYFCHFKKGAYRKRAATAFWEILVS